MNDNYILYIKHIDTGKRTRFRRISIVCRRKQRHQSQTIGLWWKPMKGTGVKNMPYKQFKFLTIGFYLINLMMWIEFKWIGKSKEDISFKVNDD